MVIIIIAPSIYPALQKNMQTILLMLLEILVTSLERNIKSTPVYPKHKTREMTLHIFNMYSYIISIQFLGINI